MGRSASAKALDETAVRLAVVAHIRHAETSYDDLLARGVPRGMARAEVEDSINQILRRWQTSPEFA